MPQDAFTLTHLCGELNGLFSGGKINRIVQPDFDKIVFTVYTGKSTQKLLLDVNPANPRIAVTEDNFDSPLTAPNFCMLLRKHLLSATIEHISIVGFDRIVKIELTPSVEFFDAQKKVLFVELMGRYSNIILTENGKVLGGNRGVNFFDNGVRPLIVNRDYLLPPVKDKKEPFDTSLIEIFEDSNGDIVKVITENVQGIATSTAKEIQSEYFAKYEKVNGKALFEVLNGFIKNTKAKPCVLMENTAVKDVFVFPYKTVSGELKFFDQLYTAEEYYFSNKLMQKKFEDLKNRLTSLVNTNLKKARKKISAILARVKEADKAEENRLKGELILANIYKIKQGQDKVTLDNYYDNTQIEIVLDTNLSPAKNSENYYKKYNKQKRALSMLAPQLEMAQNEERYLLSVVDEIALSETLMELVSVKEELVAEGVIKEQNRTANKKQVEKPYREYLIEGYTVKVGRNNVENDNLTLSARGCDIWLHSKDYHSAHAIIETNGKPVPDNVIEKSAKICAYYSKARNGGKTEIVYTNKKFVKKPPKSKLGFFTYTEYKTVTVSGDCLKEYLK